MANVDSLNFELILQDDKFKEKIEADLRAAKDFNTQLSNLLEAKKRLGSAQKTAATVAREELAATKQMNKATEEQARHQASLAESYERTKRAQERTGIYSDKRASQARINLAYEKKAAIDMELAEIRKQLAMEKTTGEMKTQTGLLRTMSTLLGSYFSIAGGTRLVKDLAAITGEFEMQRRTLQAILGDVEGANAVFDNLKNLAVESPFQFKDLTSYAKQLSAFSIPMNELYDTTKMLADVSAGLGVDMGRIILAYGQIRSASFLRGQEVRQLTEAGIPILTELAKQFEQMEGRLISAGEVFDRISKRQVSFEMVAKVFRDMTSEGGKFYDMQAVQAQTLTGKISNLKDAYQIMMAEIGEKQSGVMKGAVDWVRKLMLNYHDTGRVLIDLIAIFGVYKGVLLAVKAVQTGLFALDGWHAVAAIVGLLAGLGTNIALARKEAERFNKEMSSLVHGKAHEAEKMVSQFEFLRDKLLGCKEGTQEYRDAMSKLNQQYGEYLPDLLSEIDSLDVLQTKLAGVTNAIYERAKAYAYEASVKKIDEEFLNDDYNKSISTIINRFDESSFGKSMGKEFLSRFREEVNKNSGETAREIGQRLLGELKLGGDTFRSFFIGANEGGKALELIAKNTIAAKKAQEEWSNTIDISFGKATGYTLDQVKALEEVSNKYKDVIENARKDDAMSKEEFDNLKLKTRKEELAELIALYKSFGDTKMAKQLQNELDTLTKGFTGWRKIVNDIADKSGIPGFSVVETDQYADYLEKLRKTYKDLPQDITDTNNAYKLHDDKLVETNTLYKNQKKLIEDIAKALGIALDTKALVGSKSSSSSGKDPAQLALETEINNLKDLYNAYEKLKSAGIADATIKDTLKEMWPEYKDVINTNSYVTALLAYADAIEKFGESGKKAANNLREFVKEDSVSKLIEKSKQAKATFDARRWLDDFLGTGELLEGDGVKFDVNKLVLDYKKKLKELGDKYSKARQEWAKRIKESGGGISLKEETKGYADLMKSEAVDRANLRANALNSLGKLAEKVVNDWASLNSIDLSDFSHKSISQLNALRQSLAQFVEDGLDDEFKAMLVDLDGGSEALSKAIDKVVQEYITKADSAKFPKLIKEITDIAKAVVGLADAVSEYAMAAGKIDLARTANAIGGIGSIVGDIAQGFKSGSWAGAIAAGISSIGQAALEAATEAEELRNEIRMAAIEAQSMRFSDNLTKGIDSLFGEDTLKKIRNATLGLNKFNEALSPNRTFSFTSGFLGMGKTTKEIGQAMSELGYDLTDMYGNLNADGLQAILDTYKNLTEADKAWITEAINDSKNYAEAMEQLREVVSGIFGDLSNTIVDNMVEAFNATGDAANGLANIFDDMSQSLLKSVLNTIVLEEVLNKYEDDLLGIFRDYGNDQDYAKMMSEINGIMGSINKDLESTSTVANAILNAAQDMGWNTGESSSQNLANGIKTITEETGNLLASYINAIRADVSSLRVISVANSGYLQQILGLLPASPTLADYLNQINANTYDIKVATEDILSDLRSVMTSASGEMAIRAAVQ